MKKLVIVLSLLFGFNVSAQQEVVKSVDEVVKAVNDTTRTNGWTKKGNISFLFNQSTFDNWVAGGENNISGNLGLNYDFNYKSDDWSWDNKVIASYGIVKTKNSEFEKKTDDRFEFNSLAGKKATGYWYYSMFFNFKTQMDSGLDPETRTMRISHFFSPAYFQFGPGLLWKKSDNLKVNIAPATSKIIVVHSHFTEGLPEGVTYFGVEGGKTMRYELGAALNAYFKYEIMANVSAENILNLYSNYLEDPQNVDLDYQLNIVMKINKYLTTNFSFQAIYDDNAFEGFQTRQILGIGATYGFQ